MRTQRAPKENSAAGLVPAIHPRAAWRVASVDALHGYCLRVCFLDGTQGVVEMHDLIFAADAGVFARLADAAVFEQVFVDHGAVTWPGEIDLAPDAMYSEIKKNGRWVA